MSSERHISDDAHSTLKTNSQLFLLKLYVLYIYNVILSPWEAHHNGNADSGFPYLMILNTTGALSLSGLRNLLKLLLKNMKKYFLYLLLLSLIGKTIALGVVLCDIDCPV